MNFFAWVSSVPWSFVPEISFCTLIFCTWVSFVPWTFLPELAPVPWSFVPELALYLELFCWVSFVPWTFLLMLFCTLIFWCLVSFCTLNFFAWVLALYLIFCAWVSFVLVLVYLLFCSSSLPQDDFDFNQYLNFYCFYVLILVFLVLIPLLLGMLFSFIFWFCQFCLIFLGFISSLIFRWFVSISNLRVTSPSKSLAETVTLFLLKSAFNFNSLSFSVGTFVTIASLIAVSIFSLLLLSCSATCTFPKSLSVIDFNVSLSFGFLLILFQSQI